MGSWTKRIVLVFSTLMLLTTVGSSCDLMDKEKKLKGVGLLIPETINDQVWGTKGYTGLLKVQSTLDVNVYYREDIDSKALVENTIKEYEEMNVNLIIGHGNLYSQYFNEFSKKYPDIHFVSFNGNAENENTTSMNFKSYAMGFFGGMIAAKMSNNNSVGAIAAYKTQKEIKGFIDGAKYQNPTIETHISYVGDWNDVDTALKYVEDLSALGVDVFYPAGDGFNVPVIERVKEKGQYIIGYISEQQDFGEKTVLTSTVQHVDKLILLAAEQYEQGTLKSGNHYYDFQDNVISIGKCSPVIPKTYRKEMKAHIDKYKKTGKLPGEESNHG